MNRKKFFIILGGVLLISSFILNAEVTDSVLIDSSNIKTLTYKNKKIKLLNVPYVRQSTTYTCGASSLQAVLMYYGIEKREAQVAELAKADPDNGIRPEAIVEAAEKLGLKAIAKQNMTVQEIEGYLDKQIPVIVDIQAWKDDDNKAEWKDDWIDGHYVVVTGYDNENLFFEDPSLFGSIGIIPKKEFVERWHDFEGAERTKESETHELGIVVFGKPADISPVLHID